MPRPLLIRSETHPYHVTSRCNNKDFFPIPLCEVWEIMLSLLKTEIKEQGLVVHAFVLMGNHFHLLCHTPNANLDQIMQRFLRQSSVKISARSKTVNHLWGARYKWSLIESEMHYFQVYRYIYQNPVRARICSKVEEYPFSTLKNAELVLYPLIDGEIDWLNEVLKKEDGELIKMGLRKQQFDVNKRKLSAYNKLSVPPSEK